MTVKRKANCQNKGMCSEKTAYTDNGHKDKKTGKSDLRHDSTSDNDCKSWGKLEMTI